MLPISTCRFLAIALMVASLGLTVPAHAAPVTAAEHSQCLATGMVFSEMAQKERDVLNTLRSTVTQPTLDDRETFKELETLQQETAEIGAILQDVYADAPAPSSDTLTMLRNASPEDLLAQVEACIPET